MSFENLSPDMQSAIVSGIIGLSGAVIGALATLVATWLTRRMQKSGKVSLFAKMVYSKSCVIKSVDIMIPKRTDYICKFHFGWILSIPVESLVLSEM